MIFIDTLLNSEGVMDGIDAISYVMVDHLQNELTSYKQILFNLREYLLGLSMTRPIFGA